jgi:hypothetical protein
MKNRFFLTIALIHTTINFADYDQTEKNILNGAFNGVAKILSLGAETDQAASIKKCYKKHPEGPAREACLKEASGRKELMGELIKTWREIANNEVNKK